ncbi:MAG: acyl-CoA dehydrogenase family protein, partial [Woeseiaceae bacterium]|nr:acyl-CoA dehydrogenase family protein [Woeseiaceae bacterium]
INGSKTFITNGQHCDVVIVVTRTNPDVSASKGMTLFLIDTTTPGFSHGRNLEKIGMHASDTSEMFLEDVRVPASAVLGEPDRGFAVLMGELQRERLTLAVSAVAAAEGMLDETVAYVQERQAFGAPIARLQNTRFKLAEVATDIRVHRSFVEECKSLFMQGKLEVSTVSMAKLACTEMQGRVMDECLQLFGGYGYTTEYPISRAFVDARAQRIYGGTSEIMKEIIARSLVGR